MNDRPTISIPAPKFEQHELVTLHWNKRFSYSTKIVRRLFNIEWGTWHYETTAGQPLLYPEEVIEHRE